MRSDETSIAAAAAMLLFSWNPAYAEPDIPQAYRDAAAFWNIADPALLYAVALAESGRRLPDGSHRPWPWTLNVGGKGHYYESQTEAWTALNGFVADGKRNIDIGLMQISYRWNEETLVDPYTALNPVTNLNMGAKILAREYEASGDWEIAAGRYHSPGLSDTQRARAKRYRERVASLRKAHGGETGE